ncbi:ankyrin-3-like [Mytilus californianus]|uniref:ankyrin-3-like n=1 Tax=Mytilus californianus TaxID=6549 RepID=UPI002246AD4B|nr:ankyrin-3-like [Mytilus californianus]
MNDKTVSILNSLRDEINQGLKGIDFVFASSGSIVFCVDILVKEMQTDETMQLVIYSFINRIIETKTVVVSSTGYVDVVLIHSEENTFFEKTKKETITSSVVNLDFDIDASHFETDEKMKAALIDIVENVYKKSNGSGKKGEIKAKVMPLEFDFEAEIVSELKEYDKSNQENTDTRHDPEHSEVDVKHEKEEQQYEKTYFLDCLTMISSQRQKQLGEDLLNAVFCGDEEKFQLCLEKGAKINYQGRNGSSALHRAAWNELPKFVKLLIERGIDCNLKNWDGESALHSATSNKKTTIIKLLIESDINRNLQDKDGKSALHQATLNRKTEIVKLLIEGGIDLNLQDKDGLTALHAATKYGDTKIANLLICGTGMNLNLQNKDGLTALHIATIEGNTKIVHLLFDKDINMNLQEMHGWTALHSGAWFGKTEIVHLLIEKGIKINLKAKDGSSALHLAANNGNTEIARLLIDHHIDINLQDKSGFGNDENRWISFGNANVLTL